MANYQESRRFGEDPALVSAACEHAARSLGLGVEAQAEGKLLLKEKFNLLSFSWPATLAVQLTEDGGGTQLAASATNFGFGQFRTTR